MNIRRLIALGLLSIIFTGAAFAQKDSQDPAEWAPADAVVFLGIADTEKLWEDFQKTAIYALTQDPAVKEDKQLGAIPSTIEKFKSRLAKTLGVEPAQLKNPFKGPLAFYVSAAADAKMEDMRPNVIATVGDSGLMKKYYDAALEKLKKAADKHETVNAGSTAIDVFTTAKKEGDEDGEEDEESGDEHNETAGDTGGPDTKWIDKAFDQFLSGKKLPPSIAMCLTNDRLIVAANADAVKDALKREKRGEALIDSDDYKLLTRTFKQAGPIRYLVNVPRIVAMSMAEGDDKASNEKVMKALNLPGLRSLVGHFKFGGEGIEYRGDSLLIMKGERSGLSKILSMDNRPATPPEYVSDDVCVFGQLNLNIAKLLDEIERIIRQIEPAQADAMQEQLLNAQLLGPGAPPVNLKEELLQHLKEPISGSLVIKRPLAPDSLRFALAISHKNQDALNAFLGKFSVYMPPTDVRGTQVYKSAFGLAVAALTDRVVVGLPAAVDAALEKPGGRLSDSEDWKTAAKLIPEQCSFVMYTDDRLYEESLLELAKNKEALGAAGFMGQMFAQGLIGSSVGYDTSDEALERHRKVIKYAGKTIYAASTTQDGMQLSTVALKRDTK